MDSRSSNAPVATPIAMLSWKNMLNKDDASLICALGTSAKPKVLNAVNCMDRDRPPTNRMNSTSARLMRSFSNAQAAIARTPSKPLISSMGRNPHRSITRVVNGFMPRLPAKTANTSSPESSAERPKAS
ncbi:hypothetical protein ACVWYU_004548 [Pseudomonas sp. TE12234]